MADKNATVANASVTVGKSMFDNSYVHCHMSDGSEFKMDFYPDEIMFSKEEVLGKTEQEVYNLKGEKDRAYLRS